MIDGDSGALRTSYEGSHVSMRVSNEDPNQCESLEVDTKSAYVQGSIRSISSTRTPGSVTVRTLNNTRTTTYTVPSSAEIYYEGKTAQLRDLDSNDFITLRYTSGNEVEFISAWPGSTETSGELTAITYGSTTTLTVTRDDGTEVQFPLDMTDLPTIERDGKESTLARLALGDYVVITLRYQEVSHIDATPQNANAEGVIESVTHATDSSTLTIRLTDGEVETYTLSNSATITQDDQLVARTALQPGYKLSHGGQRGHHPLRQCGKLHQRQPPGRNRAAGGHGCHGDPLPGGQRLGHHSECELQYHLHRRCHRRHHYDALPGGGGLPDQFTADTLAASLTPRSSLWNKVLTLFDQAPPVHRIGGHLAAGPADRCRVD